MHISDVSTWVICKKIRFSAQNNPFNVPYVPLSISQQISRIRWSFARGSLPTRLYRPRNRRLLWGVCSEVCAIGVPTEPAWTCISMNHEIDYHPVAIQCYPEMSYENECFSLCNGSLKLQVHSSVYWVFREGVNTQEVIWKLLMYFY